MIPPSPGAGGWQTVAPSAVPYAEGDPVPEAIDAAGLARVRDAFAQAARRAHRVGVDVVEIHMAHGYLLHQFLSPLSNFRVDAWGGDFDGRTRFPLEVFAAIRAAWPEDKPISVRISAHDWAPGGTTPEDAVAIARLFREAGADLIDVSSGQVVEHAQPVYGRMYQTPFADLIRIEAGIATIAVSHQDHVYASFLTEAGHGKL